MVAIFGRSECVRACVRACVCVRVCVYVLESYAIRTMSNEDVCHTTTTKMEYNDEEDYGAMLRAGAGGRAVSAPLGVG